VVAVDHLQWKLGNHIIVAGPFYLNWGKGKKLTARERFLNTKHPKNCCKSLSKHRENIDFKRPSKTWWQPLMVTPHS